MFIRNVFCKYIVIDKVKYCKNKYLSYIDKNEQDIICSF